MSTVTLTLDEFLWKIHQTMANKSDYTSTVLPDGRKYLWCLLQSLECESRPFQTLSMAHFDSFIMFYLRKRDLSSQL